MMACIFSLHLARVAIGAACIYMLGYVIVMFMQAFVPVAPPLCINFLMVVYIF